MVLRMASPIKRNGSDNWYYRRTIPADIQTILQKLPKERRPRGWYKTHISISLGTADRAAAKANYANVASNVERQFKALREGPKPLTVKQIAALSGIVYRAFTEQLEANPGLTVEGWLNVAATNEAAKRGNPLLIAKTDTERQVISIEHRFGGFADGLLTREGINTIEAAGIEKAVAGDDGQDCVRKSFGFGRAMAMGFSFSSRIKPDSEDTVGEDKSINGAKFVGYELKMPLVSGTVLLDATATIDGMSHIQNNRDEVSVPELDYKNLDIHFIHNEIPEGMTVTEVLKSKMFAAPYSEFIKRTILTNANPGERVLAVVHKTLIEHGYLISGPLTDDTTRKEIDVSYLTWGTGIGTNSYKQCATVFLFSEFYLPISAFAATSLGMNELPANRSNLKPYNGNNNRRSGLLFEQREGHYRRWVKQLAMRGAARNTNEDGTCGRQRLFVVYENQRKFLRKVDKMFPGAKVSLPPPKPIRQKEKDGEKRIGGVNGLLALLNDPNAKEITVVDVRNRTGIDFNKNGKRYRDDPIVMSAI